MKIERFEDIEAWKEARKLVTEIYRSFPIAGILHLWDKFKEQEFRSCQILPNDLNEIPTKNSLIFFLSPEAL